MRLKWLGCPVCREKAQIECYGQNDFRCEEVRLDRAEIYLLAGAETCAGPSEDNQMTDYLVIHACSSEVPSTDEGLAEWLAAKSREGWDLVAVGNSRYFFRKRRGILPLGPG